MSLEIPHLPDEELRARAGRFHDQHNSDATIPVPIEEIVEFRVSTDAARIEIQPTGLWRRPG